MIAFCTTVWYILWILCTLFVKSTLYFVYSILGFSFIVLNIVTACAWHARLKGYLLTYLLRHFEIFSTYCSEENTASKRDYANNHCTLAAGPKPYRVQAGYKTLLDTTPPCLSDKRVSVSDADRHLRSSALHCLSCHEPGLGWVTGRFMLPVRGCGTSCQLPCIWQREKFGHFRRLLIDSTFVRLRLRRLVTFAFRRRFTNNLTYLGLQWCWLAFFCPRCGSVMQRLWTLRTWENEASWQRTPEAT